MDDRPASMARFDQVVMATLAVNLLTMVLSLPRLQGEMKELGSALPGIGIEWFIGQLAFGLGLILLLWYFVSRLRSRKVRWVFIALVGFHVLNSAMNAARVLSLGPLMVILNIADLLLWVTAAALLMTQDSRDWFARRRRWRPGA